MTDPWFKFRPVNWLGEPRLRMCSLAARGLWIDMMAYSHDAEPYGHFLIDGKQPSLDNLAALVGRPAREVKGALIELEENGVFSRRDDGAIYSRRMVRDHERSEEGRKQINKRWANRERIEAPNRSNEQQPNRPPNRPPNRVNGKDPNTKNLEGRISEANASSNLLLVDSLGLKEPQREQATGRKRKNKMRLPENFAPDRDFARKCGWSEKRIDEQIQAFFDSARAHNRQYADWPAAWRNWCTSPFQKPIEPPKNGNQFLPREPNPEFHRQKWDWWVKHHTWPFDGPDPDSAGCHIPQELREQWAK